MGIPEELEKNIPGIAGDLQPVLSNDGTAWMEIYTGRFYPMDVVGRTIVLHEMPDDFKTQPSGDSGMKIACGEIKSMGNKNVRTKMVTNKWRTVIQII